MRRRLVCIVVAGLAALAFAQSARADLLIAIDKSTQTMTVTVDGALRYVWPVSTGAPGYDTPSGEFMPFRMEAEHFSREWDDAPMPHSIFFTRRGHAIHGTNHKNIGQPVSHGCVRLAPQNASILFDLVKQEHMSNTRVELTSDTPAASGVAHRDRSYRRGYSNDYQRGFTAALPAEQWQDHWPRDHVMDGWPFYNRYRYSERRRYMPKQ
jgi:hypothetical protein